MKTHTAIILAGGYGTRLGGLTASAPKPLLPVAGKPFLCRIVDQCARQRIDTVIMAVGYLHEQFAPFFRKYYPDAHVSFSIERTLLGTGGALLQAVAFLPDDAPFLVLNGDTYFDVQAEHMDALQERTGTAVSIALTAMADASRYGTVEVDGAFHITAFKEKSAAGSGLVSGGVYRMHKSALGGRAPGNVFSLEKDLFPRLAAERKLSGFISDGQFIDIGVPCDYHRAQKMFREGCAL
jgi:D-glycero-alpha-D-manno-heptose 1-phosphate guanylyltransferase